MRLAPIYAAAPISNSNILWGAAAAALVGSTLAEWKKKREEEEEVAREENFGDGRKGKKGKGGGDGGYHSKIQARQMADIIRVNAERATIALEQQRQENIAAMQKAAAIAALDRLEMANKAAIEKAAAIKAALLLSLPSNGAIGLVQSVKPPVTSLGYYDLISKSYVPPLLLGDIVKRIKSGPDYISLNVPIPVLYGLVGFDLLITRDYYNNWYIGGGGAATTGPGFDIGAGWFLTNTRTEDHLETALSGHSFTVSGGNILGVGINLTDPAFTHLESDFRIKAERVALEGEGTTPGGTIVYTYSLVLYDSGNPDPWLPIIPRSWK